MDAERIASRAALCVLTHKLHSISKLHNLNSLNKTTSDPEEVAPDAALCTLTHKSSTTDKTTQSQLTKQNNR